MRPASRKAPANRKGKTVSSKSKSKNNGPAADGATEVDIVSYDPAELLRSALGARDRRLLVRVQRFLVNIQSPLFEGAASRVGYTAVEHAEGWAFYKQASGETRPLDHHFLSTRTLEKRTYDAILLELDELENVWFPRTKRIIERVVHKDARRAFLASFFRDLEQQPLGPGVVGSVRTFLDRVEALATSTEPQAKDVLKKLTERGLTSEAIARARALLDKIELGGFAEERDDGAARVVTARREMQDGADKLRGWFNDWGTTFRQVLGNANHLVLLGLSSSSRSSVTDDEIDGENEDDDIVSPPEPGPVNE